MDLAALLLSLTVQLADLTRPRISESVTVMAAAPSIATPAAVTVLGRRELDASAAVTLDDTLRSVPGFSLFRRSSSRVSNPTTQGATLRGLAASGASRALVLADGVALNDPVGGWVYWNRIPAAALDEVSVSRGAEGDIYGADALGGVVSIRTSRDTGVRALLEGGGAGTARVSMHGGTGRPDAGLFLSAEGFTTDGFITVAEADRGPIDTPANSRHASAHGVVSLATAPADLTVRASHFGESRDNGTPVQRNATSISLVSAEARGLVGTGIGWTASAYGSSQEYEQTFSAVLDGRSAERQTNAQVIGASAFGGQANAGWQSGRAPLQVGAVLAARRASADLTETPFSFSGQIQPARHTSATQWTAAAGVQARFDRQRFAVGAGLRTELWRAHDLNSHVVATPKLWTTYAAPAGVMLMASMRTGFRGPTINELYRGFRVGNIVTAANALLRPERVRGFEAGASWSRRRVTLRALAFWSRVDDAIVNVTLEPSGDLIQRERQNAAGIRAAGTEVEAELRLSPLFTVTAATAYTNSVFTEGPLSGLRVPQVARLQHALGARGAAGPLRFSAEWRYIGEQFDDDRNVFPLEGSSILDARVGWQIVPRLELFGAIENVLDEEQTVGRTPLRTIGLPRTARMGVRLSLRR